MGPPDCENAGMDETEPTTYGRRAFFGRALLLAGAGAATLTGLTGCPGGSQGDDDDDDGDDGDDD